jgi:hypothetical protein
VPSPAALRSEARRAQLAAVTGHVLSADDTGRADHCPRCRGVRVVGYARCYACTHLAPSDDGAHLSFAACVVKSSPLYAAFVNYKNFDGELGEPHRRTMAAVLSGGYDQHRDKISERLGGPPTIVSVVPSTSPTRNWANQPLRRVIDLVGELSPRAAQVLEYSGIQRIPGTPQSDLFRPVRVVAGERILLIEDLWVRGTTAETARSELLRGGASVGILSIGRELNPSFATADQLVGALGRPQWW